jgi:SAM-dependent methyltransferase
MNHNKNNTASCSIDEKSCCSSNSVSENLSAHWDKAYQNAQTENLGWYEEHPKPSIELLNNCALPDNPVIFNAGAGTSTFIDYLVDAGFNHIIANDISDQALQQLKQRLGKKAKQVTFVQDDMTHPTILNEIPEIDVWHDRAVLHFFHDEDDIQRYFNLLRSKVKQGGYVIIATFNLSGAEKCSGLPVKRYDQSQIAKRLGEEFQFIKAFDYEYIMPAGDKRPYVYTLYRRK